MHIFRVARSMGVVAGLALTLTGCGVVYHDSSVSTVSHTDGSKVRVIPITGDSLLVANRDPYTPKQMPAVFDQVATASASTGKETELPPSVFDPKERGPLQLRVPPAVDPGPYTIGVGDVVVLATPKNGSTVEQLSGLLAAQNSRQGYTVQDDGSIAIPNVGRVKIAGMTLEEAEAELFQRLVQSQIDPTFSLEISGFNSKKVSVGGAVGEPKVLPVTLTPLYLDEALNQAGGVKVTDLDYASVRIYRDGTLYQIPLDQLYSNDSLKRIRLLDGDSVFVDTSYELGLAQSYFQEQISRANFKQSERAAALNRLNSEISLRRGQLSEARSNFQTKLQQDAVPRDYVYMAGEVGSQGRFTLPFGREATLADALFSKGGIQTIRANAKQIYVLRGSSNPREFGSVTAWQLNVQNAANILLATKFELRPDDVIFIAPQPVTRWNRVLNQITPTIINQGVAVANRNS